MKALYIPRHLTEKEKKLSFEKLNKRFKIVFEPYEGHPLHGKRRFAVGAYSLYKYVGHTNAFTAILGALKSLDDKFSIKFRKHGIVEFYYK